MVNLLTPLFAKLPIPYSNNILFLKPRCCIYHTCTIIQPPYSFFQFSCLLPLLNLLKILSSSYVVQLESESSPCSVAFIFSGFELKTQNKVFRDRHFYFYTTCFFSNDCKVFLFMHFIMRT